MDRVELAIEQWRRERPDLELLPMEVVARLTTAAALIVRQRLLPFFEAHGLQTGEFDVIATLRRSGKPYRLTPTALYESAMMSSGGMTARIDRLERAGLVERHPNPKDRRGTLVGLTKRGSELVDDLVGGHVENEREAITSLNPDEQVELNRLLSKLMEGLGTVQSKPDPLVL